MKKTVYKVPGMSCGHCVMRVQKALSALDGVDLVEIDLESKDVEVDYEAPADDAAIRAALEEIGYPAEA